MTRKKKVGKNGPKRGSKRGPERKAGRLENYICYEKYEKTYCRTQTCILDYAGADGPDFGHRAHELLCRQRLGARSPYGWDDTFYDSRLNGYWALDQINSSYVDGTEVNYLYFGGNGRGRYYYYDRGQRYWENTAYWCQNSVSGTSNYQINLQYETVGSPTTMNYWFTDSGRTLWMQWSNSGGVQTYVYRYYPSEPW